MSLDVYLTATRKESVTCSHCSKPHDVEVDDRLVYESNITHNLGKMAKECGLYEFLWRPEEVDITHARELIGPLTEGLGWLKSDPERFKKFNSPNGWGMYEHFVRWVERYLQACIENPDAKVSVSQ